MDDKRQYLYLVLKYLIHSAERSFCEKALLRVQMVERWGFAFTQFKPPFLSHSYTLQAHHITQLKLLFFCFLNYPNQWPTHACSSPFWMKPIQVTRTVQINVPNLPGKAFTKQLPFLKNDDGISDFLPIKSKVLTSFHETVIEQESLRRSSLRSAGWVLRYFLTNIQL